MAMWSISVSSPEVASGFSLMGPILSELAAGVALVQGDLVLADLGAQFGVVEARHHGRDRVLKAPFFAAPPVT